ncbi:MAG: ribonuclease R [Eubacteriales bacterium]|nr:ribonuclease R [Eubacteriales bacterium]
MNKQELQDEILRLITEADKPLGLDTLQGSLQEEKGLDAALKELLKCGSIIATRKGKFAIPSQCGMHFGRVQGHARGFGFFIPQEGGPDAFIPADAIHGAMNGDKVWVRYTEQKSRNGSPECEVMTIADRAYTEIVGTYELDEKSGGYVVPDDNKIPQDAMIQRDKSCKAKSGDKVAAKILRYPDGRRPMVAAIVDVLGNKDDADTELRSIMRQYGLSEQFPKAVLTAANRVPQTVSSDESITREILRDRMIVTIDGADAKDFDDAVSCERLKNGNWYLGVHIADVSAYVPEDSALDREAYQRGTSVYLSGKVLPMLPEALSNGICSLNEGVDRLTLSCFMEIDTTGRVVRHKLSQTLIRSRHRLVYEDVTKLLAGDGAMEQKYADASPMLHELERLAAVLQQKRVQRGSIDFDLAEADIKLDAKGRVLSIDKAERGVANHVIEECMLIANETVAKYMQELHTPILYRVHEAPGKEKLTELNAFLGTLGYGLKNMKDIQPRALQRVLDAAKGSKEENIVNKVVLRSMQKARYCETCLGHFGLAAKQYCHFTSPIRRYPDLLVHRALKEVLCGTMTEKRKAKLAAKLPEAAEQTSARERVAVEAERAVEDYRKCAYMKEHIGEEFMGVISGVTSFGFFVELENTVEGLVKNALLDDDAYEYDEKNYRIKGRNRDRQYRLGDTVRVRADRADTETRNIDFALLRG